MSIEFAAIFAVVAFTGVAILLNMVVFHAMFGHADRLSGRRPAPSEDLPELTT